MKFSLISSGLLAILFFASCDMINQAMPGIDTSIEKTYQIQIRSNSGSSDAQLIDISTAKEYKDFRNNIEKYDLKKISYKIRNCNTPDSMYFEGTLICSNEEETEEITVGAFHKDNLIKLDEVETEQKLTLYSQENVETVLAWLMYPGKFKMKSEYKLTDGNGNPFLITGGGYSNFEIVVKVYLTVKTKL